MHESQQRWFFWELIRNKSNDPILGTMEVVFSLLMSFKHTKECEQKLSPERHEADPEYQADISTTDSIQDTGHGIMISQNFRVLGSFYMKVPEYPVQNHASTLALLWKPGAGGGGWKSSFWCENYNNIKGEKVRSLYLKAFFRYFRKCTWEGGGGGMGDVIDG